MNAFPYTFSLGQKMEMTKQPVFFLTCFPFWNQIKANYNIYVSVQIVFSKFTDLLPSEVTNEDDPELQKPDEETIMSTTEKTRQALEKLTQGKIAAAMPVRHADKQVSIKPFYTFLFRGKY